MKVDRLDIIEEYKTDSVYEQRMSAIRDLSFKEKLELALEEGLITDKFLEDLIYDSSISYSKIKEDW